MINETYYNKRNLVALYFKGSVKHFMAKDASVTIEWYNYTISTHETIYTIASKVFGKGLEHMWTYIADNNPPRFPDDWSMGDIIRLPKIIVRDSDTIR